MFDVIACCFCCRVIANVETARQSRHCCGISAEAFNGSLEPLHRQTWDLFNNNKQPALDPRYYYVSTFVLDSQVSLELNLSCGRTREATSSLQQRKPTRKKKLKTWDSLNYQMVPLKPSANIDVKGFAVLKCEVVSDIVGSARSQPNKEAIKGWIEVARVRIGCSPTVTPWYTHFILTWQTDSFTPWRTLGFWTFRVADLRG